MYNKCLVILSNEKKVKQGKVRELYEVIREDLPDKKRGKRSERENPKTILEEKESMQKELERLNGKTSNPSQKSMSPNAD